MPWLGIGLVVLAVLAVILVLTRNKVTIVAPPASITPSPAKASSTGTAGQVGNPAAGHPRLSAQVRVTTTLGQATSGTSGDAAALLAKMGLPGGLVEQAKESLHRAEAACPRYPDSTLVFSAVNLSRSGDPAKDRQGEADRLVLRLRRRSGASPPLVRELAYRSWLADWGRHPGCRRNGRGFVCSRVRRAPAHGRRPLSPVTPARGRTAARGSDDLPGALRAGSVLASWLSQSWS